MGAQSIPVSFFYLIYFFLKQDTTRRKRLYSFSLSFLREDSLVGDLTSGRADDVRG